MTRILYWNIENFSVNKFWDISRKRKKGSAGGNAAQQAADRLDYFLYAFDNQFPNGTPACANRTPEIVVIVELESGVVPRGCLVNADGPVATQNLVTQIRAWTANNNWMAVPPLYTGPTEGVIVLYNSANLIFTGPNIWPGGGGPSAIPPAPPGVAPPAPASPYPAAWNTFIRTGALSRSIPAGAQYNANRWENQMAARVAGFTSSAGAGLVPPPGGMPPAGINMDGLDPLGPAGPAGPLGPRTPYMVTFFRPAGGGAPAENITLFAIHAPASGNAYNYMTALACTQQIAAALGVNERRVVVGDFNLDMFTAAGALRQRYQYFQQLGYAIAVVPPGGGPPAPPLGYYDYFCTHLFPYYSSANWSTVANNRYYPGYLYQDELCIDNIFVNNGALANTTILNPVVGSPYNQNPPPAPGGLPPGGAPPGHFDMDILADCYQGVNVPPAVAPGYMAGMNTTWRDWDNIRRIRSTSDHLPIIADF